MKAPRPEEFKTLVSDEQTHQLGTIRQVFPTQDFSRSAISQFGVGIVGAAVAIGFLIISFQVVISPQPDEQLPFQQAMWGIAGVGGILCLYGVGTGAARAAHGLSRVGRWWLLCEQGLIILNQGRTEWSGTYDQVQVQSGANVVETLKLVTGQGKKLPLPLQAENITAKAIRAQAQQSRRATQPAVSVAASATTTPPPIETAYVMGWWEAGLSGDDAVYRIYADGPRLLILYAGKFQSKMLRNVKSTSLGAGLVQVLASHQEWLFNKDYKQRQEFLDSLQVDELRAETKNNTASLLIDASTTTEVTLGALEERFFSADLLRSAPFLEPLDEVLRGVSEMFNNSIVRQQCVGWLTFRHNGKYWKLGLFSQEEMEYVKSALTTALGERNFLYSTF